MEQHVQRSSFTAAPPVQILMAFYAAPSSTFRILYMREDECSLQVLSPLVPVCEVNFLRFCKQHAEGIWAVVDVSINAIRENSGGPTFQNYRRVPSGCVLQDMPNGYSKTCKFHHKLYMKSYKLPPFRASLNPLFGKCHSQKELSVFSKPAPDSKDLHFASQSVCLWKHHWSYSAIQCS